MKEPRHSRCIAASAGEKEQDEPAVTYNKEFGYSRKDVLLIGVSLIAFGYALYYGLQATGLDPMMAGNVPQLIIIVGLCILWVGSYVFRVMNKVSAPLIARRLLWHGSLCAVPVLHIKTCTSTMPHFSSD